MTLQLSPWGQCTGIMQRVRVSPQYCAPALTVREGGKQGSRKQSDSPGTQHHIAAPCPAPAKG